MLRPVFGSAEICLGPIELAHELRQFAVAGKELLQRYHLTALCHSDLPPSVIPTSKASSSVLAEPRRQDEECRASGASKQALATSGHGGNEGSSYHRHRAMEYGFAYVAGLLLDQASRRQIASRRRVTPERYAV